MAYLVDTNVLLRVAERSSTNRALAISAMRTLVQRGEKLCFTSQNLGECWNVCTRPLTSRGGLGLSLVETERRARLLERQFTLPPDNISVHHVWRQLLVSYGIRGVGVHDARLVAAMIVHGIPSLLTFDVADFARYREIAVVHPGNV